MENPFRIQQYDADHTMEHDALAYAEAGCNDEAIARFTDILGRVPNNPQIYMLRGQMHYLNDDPQQGMYDCRTGIESLHNNPAMYREHPEWCINAYNNLLHWQDKCAQAQRLDSPYDDLLAVNSGVNQDFNRPLPSQLLPASRNLIGEMAIAESAKDYNRAAQAVSGIIALEPQRISAYLKRGQLYNKLQNYPLAYRDFKSGRNLMLDGRVYNHCRFNIADDMIYKELLNREAKARGRMRPWHPIHLRNAPANLFKKYYNPGLCG